MWISLYIVVIIMKHDTVINPICPFSFRSLAISIAIRSLWLGLFFFRRRRCHFIVISVISYSVNSTKTYARTLEFVHYFMAIHIRLATTWRTMVPIGRIYIEIKSLPNNSRVVCIFKDANCVEQLPQKGIYIWIRNKITHAWLISRTKE